MKRLYAFLIVAIAALATPGVILWRPSAALTTTVDIDAGTRFQTIDGWAVYPRYWEEDKAGDRYDRSFEPYTEEVSQFLVNEVGINSVRIEIWSGLENPVDHWIGYYEGRVSYSDYARVRYEKVNDNDDPHSVNPAGFQFSRFDHCMEVMTLPLKRALEARGEKLHVNVNYVDFSWGGKALQGSLSHAENPEEFAEFVLVFFKRLREKYAIEADSFEVILEPENTAGWRAPRIGRGLVAVARRLEENGFTPEIIAPSNTSMRNAIKYFDEMIEVDGVDDYLDTFGYHRYGLQTRSLVEAVRSRAEDHRLKTAMLEKIGAGIDVLLEDLTAGNVSSWQQWAAAGRKSAGDDGDYYALVDTNASERPRVYMAGLSRQLSRVFLYVRRGAVRIDARSDNPDKTGVAFMNRDGGRIVIVRARRTGGPVTINGLPAGRYGLGFTDDLRETEQRPAVTISAGESLRFEMPRSGVATLYSLQQQP
jgi:hypothetical protein